MKTYLTGAVGKPQSTFVMIPTYNESENIAEVIGGILALRIPRLDIVVVDDSSPDGTAAVVKEIMKRRGNVRLLLRAKDRGRGYAGRDGFLYCLKEGADVIIEMDGDFSHHPRYIPLMLKEIQEYDLVLGSRMVKGGHDIGRSAVRRAITRMANFYITLMLGIKVRDCNSGFRCFRRELVESIHPETLQSQGPSIVQEVLFRAHLTHARIKEIPIDFVDRMKGKSKLGLRELFMGYMMVMKLKVRHFGGKPV